LTTFEKLSNLWTNY